MEMYYLFCTAVSAMMRNQRALTGSADSWERLRVGEFSDLEWRQNFRMRRQSFTKLCGLLEGIYGSNEVGVRSPIRCFMRVPVFNTWWLCRVTPPLPVSYQYSIPKSSSTCKNNWTSFLSQLTFFEADKRLHAFTSIQGTCAKRMRLQKNQLLSSHGTRFSLPLWPIKSPARSVIWGISVQFGLLNQL